MHNDFTFPTIVIESRRTAIGVGELRGGSGFESWNFGGLATTLGWRPTHLAV